MNIYKTTNLINGKIYVGKSCNNKIDYLGSGSIILRAIRKYGKENFQKEILEECSTLDELSHREIYWIDKLNSRDPKIGYNISTGGDGIHLKKLSEEHRKKLSESHKGKKLSEEHKLKISESHKGEKHPMYGKTHSEETRIKLRNSHVGVSKSPHTEESKQKMRNSQLGEKNHMYGKKLSDETKEKMRIKRKEYWRKKNERQ